MTRDSNRSALRLTGDHALGVAGIGLAVASAAFGIGMAMHGPVASLGSGHDFTVFAQLAPRRIEGGEQQALAGRGRVADDDLDTTATASIPKADRTGPETGNAAVIPAVTLEAVGTDSATVAIEGRTRVVRIGDEVPGAGHVIAILPGARPVLKTSRGLIVPAAE